jgi:cell division protease FtsH
MKLPVEDKKMHSRSEYLDELAVLLGGYAAERLVFHDLTTGASDDLKKATEIARELVTKYGMSDKLGPRSYGKTDELIFLGKEIHEQRDYSEKLAEEIDKEINRLLAQAKKTAEEILTRRREVLNLIARTLLEKETLEKEAFETLLGAKAV